MAANYVTSISNVTLSPQGTYFTVTGGAIYNPAGVGVPSNGNYMCGAIECRYGPAAAFRYKIINGGSEYFFLAPNTTPPNSSVISRINNDGGTTPKQGYDILSAALKEKLGAVISINQSMQLLPMDGKTRILLGLGVCMVTATTNADQGNRTIDESSCSWMSPTNSCNVQNSVILDHGNLQFGSVNGNKKNNNMRISCSGASSAKLLLLPDTINLAPGLISKITVNGKSTEQTIPLRAGDNNITVESTLVDSGAKAGAFQGSTTLVVSFQ